MKTQPSIPLVERKDLEKNSPKQKRKPLQLKISRTHKPEHLELEEWQRLLRKEFGQKQAFILKNQGDHPLFSEFSITNPETDKTYKVAIRGAEVGMNYCSCPDYSINHLGTCKHIEFTLAPVNEKAGG